ncbi:alpha-(1-_3)-arabinofuranosyltransferase family protein [Streptomyces sp. NPDC093982]|uniref:alpha-(1->3)-arabinofuranosyltransferase domain-containing protein n=1 Tax=Streptomyces sp. NPDC093982 TaxID=3155077 RepID=UPI003420418E
MTTTAPTPTTTQGHRWLLAFWIAVFTAFLAVSPGKTTFETKLGVALDPFKFISDLGGLWHDRAGFGGMADQYIGYAFPALPYYALMDLAHVPVWLAERLWLSLIVTAAFWGALRIAERLGVGTSVTRLLGAVCYALWPTFTIIIGSTSAAALPGAILPWVLLPLTRTDLSVRRTAARSAVLIPFMGGVNAASTLASLLPVGLYLLSRPAGPRKRPLLAWWSLGVVLATAWWVVPLLLLGIYGEDFMPYVEQAHTTTGTMSATELLRGAGNWVAYLNFGHPWLPAGRTVATTVITVLCSAFAAALGLAGLARRDLPERRWLLMTALSVVVIALAGYGGAFGAPFDDTVQAWLNSWLKPFRNIYKFQPGLALVLTLGLTHLTARVAEWHGVAPVAGRRASRRSASSTLSRNRVRAFLPAAAALFVLPGLIWPYVNGSILQPGAFTKLPSHWSQAADWLEKYAPDNRALVVPATAHGIYTWGSPIDQPLDVLAKSRWAQRDFVPFGTPGSRRVVDAVEQALMSGSEVPGLRDFLGRAGLWDVVVRNDLDPDQIGYVPPQIVKKTLESSGYRKVAGFGPLITGGRIPDDTPVDIQGLFPRLQAVEIYEPADAAAEERPKQVALKPVEDTAVVSGGPEALLQLSSDPQMRERPSVLTGDDHPGIDTPPLQAVADGLRRADTRFGLVNNNTSYTYTADERNPPDSFQDPGAEPKQILPTSGIEHQTTAVLRGAKKVTASSSGHWLFHLPQYDPVNAFDGNPDTAWAEGSPSERDDQWLRIDFTSPTSIPSEIQVDPMPAGNGTRSAPTLVGVETDEGYAETPLEPNGLPQSVRAPKGKAKWLRIKILDVQESRPGLPGAGFSEVSIPGVRVTKLLELPRDAERTGASADAEVFSLHRSSDPGGLSLVSAETGLHRQFRIDEKASGKYRMQAQALPVPGDELEGLLKRIAPEQRGRITATADSTSRTSASLSARNLVDGDWMTAWIAGDKPVIHLKWPKKRAIDEVVFQAAGGISTRPEEVQISSPYGSTTAGVDKNGQARFEPITTDRLDITVSRTASVTLYNPIADSKLQLPVGLSELYVPALTDLIAPAPDPDEEFSLPCGEGPALMVDGAQYATKASGSVRDLTEGRLINVELCKSKSKGKGKGKAGTLELGAGRHVVEAGDTGPLALMDVTLSRGKEGLSSVGARPVKATDWLGDRRLVTVGAGEASYLQTYENANDGWTATLDGKELTPLRIDGWQQAWLIPAGQGGTVTLEYEPSGLYKGGLAAGAAGVLALAALAFGSRRGGAAARRAYGGSTAIALPPTPGRGLGVVALSAVVALVAGALALIVPVLAYVARRRPQALVPTAAVAMVGAAIVAAAGAGGPVSPGDGAFSALAQVLAMVAFAAAVVTADQPSDQEDGGTLSARQSSTEPAAHAGGKPSLAASRRQARAGTHSRRRRARSEPRRHARGAEPARTTDELPDLGLDAWPSDEVAGAPNESLGFEWGDPSSHELVGVESELTNLRVDDLPSDQVAGIPTETPELGIDDLPTDELSEASGAQHDHELHIALGPVMPGSADPTSIWPVVRGLN